MAEFLGQTAEPAPAALGAMGKPLSFAARQVGFDHCKAMGLDSARAMLCVDGVAAALARDQPYEAMQAGMLYLDLTGVYSLFAVLLTAAIERPAT